MKIPKNKKKFVIEQGFKSEYSVEDLERELSVLEKKL